MPADIHGSFNLMISATGTHVSQNHDTSLKGEKLKKNMFCTLAFQTFFSWGIGGFCLVLFFLEKECSLIARKFTFLCDYEGSKPTSLFNES